MPKRKRENCTEAHYCFFQRKEVTAAYRIGPQRFTRKGELIANRELALDLLTLPKCRIGKKWRLGEPKVSALVSKMAETPIPRELWEEAEVTREKWKQKADPWLEEPEGCIERYGSRLLPEEMARLEEIRRKKGYPIWSADLDASADRGINKGKAGKIGNYNGGNR